MKTLKKIKQRLQTLQTGKGASSRGGTPATTRASTPMPSTHLSFLMTQSRLNSRLFTETRSEPSSLAADPGTLLAVVSGTNVAQALVTENNDSMTKQSGSQLPSGTMSINPPDDPTVCSSLSLPLGS
jgi:hypothetical protein